MANKKMTALCMAAMLAASLGSVASASESGITFPLEESYSFSIMTRAENDSEQDFSKKALVQRMEAATNVQVDYQTIPADQFDEKSKLALSKKGMPDVITKMYIKPYDILSYASKGIFIPIEDYIEEDMPNLKAVLEKRPEVKAAITSADGHIYTLPFINEWSTNPKENINSSGSNLCRIACSILREDFRIYQSFAVQLMEPFQSFSHIILYQSVINLFVIAYHIMIHIIAAAKRA